MQHPLKKCPVCDRAPSARRDSGRGDGCDLWRVLDRKTKRSTQIGATDTAWAIAIGQVRTLNAKARKK